jgi:streptomycin 6-kinase
MSLTVPESFASGFDDEGAEWLAGLPALAESLLERWHLTVDGEPMHGVCALALPVRRAGEQAVLKVTWPHEEAEHEALALRLWDGEGAVRLLAHDPADWAMLLERLDPTTSLLDVPISEAVAVAAELMRTLDRPAPPGLGTVAATAARWVGEFPEQNTGLVPAELVAQAVAYCRELGPRSANRLVNQDLHYENVLRGTRAPWLLIDPKPIAGDPEFGLFQLLSNRFDESTPDSRLADVVAATGLDLSLARRWTFVRAIDNWLDCDEEDWLGDTSVLIATALA